MGSGRDLVDLPAVRKVRHQAGRGRHAGGRRDHLQAGLDLRRPGVGDLAMAAGLKVYDLIPVRKDVMVIRAVRA